MRVFFVLILLFFSVQAHAQKWGSGETTNKEAAYAATLNDSGGMLAQYCYYDEGGCYWTLSTDNASCEPKESYPAMVNSDAGALHVSMYCYTSKGGSRMAFKDFNEIDRAIKAAKTIAIVVPMASGGFRVSRFDLVGAGPVIASMREVVARRVKASTKDVTL